MDKPVIIVNFKTYEQGTGEKAVELARVCDKVAKDTGSNIIVAVQASDIYRVSQAVSIPVFAQHVDPDVFGSHTGDTLAGSVKEAGASGTLLNHSEHRLRIDLLEEAVDRARSAGLKIVICANNPEIGEAVEAFKPDFVAVEPPELIGGDVSVSSAKPEVIKEAVRRIFHSEKSDKLLVGAGVKDSGDLKKSLELGAAGVLLASGVVKAKNPKEVLRDLASVRL